MSATAAAAAAAQAVSAPSRTQVLRMYRALRREGSKFASYNYREYALERIRYGFEAARDVRAPDQLQQLYAKAQESLKMLQRQTALNRMYAGDKLVLEH